MLQKILIKLIEEFMRLTVGKNTMKKKIELVT
jgi:hypothetical protein